MRFYPTIIVTLSVLALVGFVLGIGVVVLLSTRWRARLVDQATLWDREIIALACAIASTGALGSLYLSEIVHLAPCNLCWYQRIAMYPLAPILGIGALRMDSGVWRYALPLSLGGMVVSAYHVMIQWRPDLDLGTCAIGVPCSGRYVAVFGFVSIPTLAGAAFLTITGALLLVRAIERSEAADR